MDDKDLLAALYEATKLVRYYESAEGEWANERAARLRAKTDQAELLGEAIRRGLDLSDWYKS